LRKIRSKSFFVLISCKGSITRSSASACATRRHGGSSPACEQK